VECCIFFLFLNFCFLKKRDNPLYPPFERKVVVFHASLVGWIALDWIIQLAAGISLEFLLPLRPLLLVALSQRSVKNLLVLGQAIWEAKDILGVYFGFIVLSSVFALLQFRYGFFTSEKFCFFRHLAEEDDPDNPADDEIMRFRTVLGAFAEMFVLISSMGNYRFVFSFFQHFFSFNQ
jgi:hypothetical protein